MFPAQCLGFLGTDTGSRHRYIGVHPRAFGHPCASGGGQDGGRLLQREALVRSSGPPFRGIDERDVLGARRPSR
jgi:hypothetical protein